MKINLPALLLTLFILCYSGIVFAQSISREVVGASAETYSSPNLSLTIVVGQPYGELLVNAGSNLFFTTGFVQPDIVLQTQLSASNLDAFVLYPNPTADGLVKLVFNHVPNGTYTISLIDVAGKVLRRQDVSYSLGGFAYLPLDVSFLSGGIYIVRIVSKDATFQGQVKLIKI